MIASEAARAGGARGLAVEILAKVDSGKAYADILLDRACRHPALGARDRALLTELTYGTLRWRGRIDWHLNRRLHRPLADLDALIRNLLRVALYQLFFLDRIPDYAAVNDAVQLAKDRGGSRRAGFVNGVLRGVLRDGNSFPDPDAEADPIAALAALWSHPEWLVRKWLEYFGREQAEKLLKADNDAAPLVIRANALKTKREALVERLVREGVDAVPTPWSPRGIWIRSGSAVAELPGFQDGLFQVQGEASQLVAHLLAPEPGERILDACAAPGGKATHIAELMEDRGEITAADLSARGLRKIVENTERLGLSSIHPVRADMSRAAPAGGPYDRVLVDAPCSGLGVLRSHPEIRWHRYESDIERLSRLQKTILDRACAAVKPGGVLVYATCTLTVEENESVVEDFLARRKEFVLEDAARYLPPQARDMIRGSYYLALPQRHQTDGFFAARMRKVS